VEHLTELQRVLLAGKLQVAAHEHNHAARGARRLAVRGGDVVLALLEREPVELVADGLRALDLLALEREHGALLVETDERLPVSVERAVVVIHKRLAQRIGVHFIQTGARSIADLCCKGRGSLK